jgi:arsenate reductase (glutaredoxin)
MPIEPEGRTMSARMYGFTHCDTVKKARAFLSERGVRFDFIDYKKQGVPPGPLAAWMAALGWEVLLNRKGTTWRQLDEALRASVTDPASAKRLMLDQPSVIKRPVMEWADGQITVGFDAAQWSGRV